MPDFGNSFKSARESKNLTLEKISKETRIGTRFLRAIEDEAFHVLPGGIFNRGFIRTYAERVGLDPEAKLSEYAALTSDVGTPELESTGGLPEPRSSSDRHVLPIAVGALVVVILLYYVSSGGGRLSENESPVDAPTATEAASLVRPAPIEPTRQREGTAPVTATHSASTATSEASAAPAEIAAVDEEIRTPAPPRDADAVATRDVTASQTVGETAPLNVQLQVHDSTWISLQSDGEQVVEGATLTPGTNRSFTAVEALELTIGNAAGLTLRINGQEVPSLGRQGQVRVLRITPGNYRQYTGG